MAEIKFEEALKKLEKIVQDLESAKKKIDILTKNKKGEFDLKPLDEAKLEE